MMQSRRPLLRAAALFWEHLRLPFLPVQSVPECRLKLAPPDELWYNGKRMF